MRALRAYLRQLAGVMRTVSGNPGLLRAELAYVGFNMAEWATWVSILAYAYQVGGAPATGPPSPARTERVPSPQEPELTPTSPRAP